MTECVAKYVLGISAKYHFGIANKGYIPYDDEQQGNLSDFKDVLVTPERNASDINEIQKKVLFSVNGFIHSSVVMDNKLYIEGAVESLIRSGYNQIGVLSFGSLPCDMDRYKIPKENIGKLEGYSMYEKVAIKFDEPIEGCFLVFAGYIIHEQEGFFERVSDSLFYLYPERLGLLDKLYELNKYYDIYDYLRVPKSTVDDSAVLKEDATTDDVIIRLLTRTHTFLCGFKGFQVTYEHIPMEFTSIPNQFRVERFMFNNFPVFAGNGKMVEYKNLNLNPEKTLILTVDAYYTNLRQSYKPERLLTLTGKAKMIGDAYRLGNAYMRKILFTKL